MKGSAHAGQKHGHATNIRAWPVRRSLAAETQLFDDLLVSGLILSFQRRSAKTPRGGFDSGAMFLGLTRKLLMLLLVILGYMVLATVLKTAFRKRYGELL